MNEDVDTRLTGVVAEYTLAWLLRKRDIVCTRLDIEGFDLIAFDTKKSLSLW
jgi:hypothetical protein